MNLLIVQYPLDCTYILSEQARCSTRYMSAHFFKSRSDNTRKLTVRMFWVTYFRVKFNDDCSGLIILLSLLLFHVVPSTFEALFDIPVRALPFRFVEVRVPFYGQSCHSSSHLAIFEKFVVAKILLQRWKLLTIGQ